ncbi:17477_t:CDS:2 [Cetraspora pellucida]|uniref:17477_t:CDS:1 n=1 Tax=Cetraspora pellucida TaxID=1433469 RepID=A0ACA9JVM6_9GLOM|nr:17477_t:CDS:2 [Cetraspora pellucida]
MFREATAGVAAAAHPLRKKTNLVLVEIFKRREENDPLEWIETSTVLLMQTIGLKIKEDLKYWDNECMSDLSIAKLPTLEQVIEGARKIEAGEYYQERNNKKNEKEYLKSNIDDLNKHMQVGHMAKECISERRNPAKRTQNNLPIQIMSRPRDVNFVELEEDEEYTPEAEEEVFVTPETHYQPYFSQRTRSHNKKSESQAEKRQFCSPKALLEKGEYHHWSSIKVPEPIKKFGTSPKKINPSGRDPHIMPGTDKDKYHPNKENQLTKILILYDEDLPLPKSKDNDESEGTFDEFEYKDEELKKAEDYFTKEVLSDELYDNS